MVDSAGDLAAHRDQQTDIRDRKFSDPAAADDEATDDFFLGPEHDHIGGLDAYAFLNFAGDGRERKAVNGEKRGMSGA